MKQDKQADWFSWTLFFLTGAVGGALFGFPMFFGRIRVPLPATAPYLILFLLACGLICGGILSLKGNTFFYGEGPRTLPTDRPEHNTGSRIASIFSIVGGLILAASLFLFQ